MQGWSSTWDSDRHAERQNGHITSPMATVTHQTAMAFVEVKIELESKALRNIDNVQHLETNIQEVRLETDATAIKSNKHLHLDVSTQELDVSADMCDPSQRQRSNCMKNSAKDATSDSILCLGREIKSEPQECEDEGGNDSANGSRTPPGSQSSKIGAEVSSEGSGNIFRSSEVDKIVSKSGASDLDRKYKCGTCGAAFRYSSHLKTHIRLHTGEKPYKCETCGICFTHSGTLKKHIRVHASSGQFACKYCDVSFDKQTKLTLHTKVHFRQNEAATRSIRSGKQIAVDPDVGGTAKEADGSGILLKKDADSSQVDDKQQTKCNVDSLQCKSLSGSGRAVDRTDLETDLELGIHFEPGVKAEPPTDQGNEQDGVPLSHQSVKTGLMDVNGTLPKKLDKSLTAPKTMAVLKKRHVCDVCGLSFPNPSRLKFHKFTHTGECPFICKECGEAFNRPDVLKKHRRVHADEKKFACTECKAAFRDNENLKTHMRIHTGEKPYKCDLCGMSFTYSSSLKSHKYTHTGESPFVCKVCGAAFTRSETLGRHMRGHAQENLPTFTCTQCEKSFKDLGALRKHALVHSSEKPFVCHDCMESFSTSTELKTHTVLHMVAKPFSCDHCDSSFSHASGLRQHMRVHTGERPFVCDECGKSFAQAGNLNQHKRIHEGDKLFACVKCGVKYGKFSSLTRHMNTKHRGERLRTMREFVIPTDTDSNAPIQMPLSAIPTAEILANGENSFSDESTHQIQPLADVKQDMDSDATEQNNVRNTNNSKTASGLSELNNNTSHGPQPDIVNFVIKTEQPNFEDQFLNSSVNSLPDGDISTQKQGLESESARICVDKSCMNNSSGSLNNTDKEADIPAENMQSPINGKSTPHSSETGPFLCVECGDMFADSKLFKDHVRGHKFNSSLQLHPISARTTQAGDSPFVCGSCGVSFMRYWSLKKHLHVHAGEIVSGTPTNRKPVVFGERPYTCRECGESFHKSSGLKRHMSEHTCEKPFPCGECQASFTCSQDLKRHARKHTGEKPFKCNICGACFTHCSSRKQHMRVHTGERPFVCDECGEAFAKSGNLNKHKLIHTGERLFKCEHCGVPFNVIGSLTRHINTRHREKET